MEYYAHVIWQSIFIMKYILSVLSCVLVLIGCLENTKPDTTYVEPANADQLFSEKNLPVQVFKIDIQTDNSLVTNSGVIIQIPRGSLTSDKNPVELEIQEAIGLKDILLAGLQTRSNREALSSGGMVYINARQGYNITIREKLKMFVPTQNYNKEMQVYEGIKDSTGNINWVNPQPLPVSKVAKRLSRGEQIFIRDCSSCHAVHKDATGPALYNVQNRRPKKWLYDFTRNSAALISQVVTKEIEPAVKQKSKKVNYKYNPRYKNIKQDSSALAELLVNGKIKLAEMHDSASPIQDYYSSCIFNKWNRTAMTAFPNLKDKDLEDLYTFIKLESDKRPDLAKKFEFNCCDSCEIYKRAVTKEAQVLSKVYEEQNKLFSIRQTVALNKNTLQANIKSATPFQNIPGNPTTIVPNSSNRKTVDTGRGFVPRNDIPVMANRVKSVSPDLMTGVFYELDITTFGWKNIDILIAGKDGVLNSMLWVRVAESTRYKLRVQLLIPSHKICLAGGRAENDDFSFKTIDGMVYLPQGVKCFIVAISEKEEKLYFDMKEFTSSTNQTIEIKLMQKSADEINKALNDLNVTGLASNVKPNVKVKELREVEKQIQQIQTYIDQYENIKDSVLKRIRKLDRLIPKNCGCGSEFAEVPPGNINREIIETDQ